MAYNFGEKTKEYSFKTGKEVPVWQSPKYKQSRDKAIEIIEKYDNIREGDFWILMNETKKGDKMIYTGLIISHNACLKLNNHLPEEMRFVPSCVEFDKNGYNNSLVFMYSNDAQGIYEVGEVSRDNCKNGYPYAMAYKRLFDRVVLKNSRLAYDGIYSDSEADEFKEPQEVKEDLAKEQANFKGVAIVTQEQADEIAELAIKDNVGIEYLLGFYSVKSLKSLSMDQYEHIKKYWTTHIIRSKNGVPR